MPRTKKVPPKAASKAKNLVLPEEIVHMKKIRMDHAQQLVDQYDAEMNALLKELQERKIKLYASIPAFLLDKTVGEIIAGEVSSQTTAFSDIEHNQNSTRSASVTRGAASSTLRSGSRTNSATRAVPNSTLKTNSSTASSTRSKRSLSAANDASSESSRTDNHTGAGRKSRSRAVNKNIMSAKPISRSLSRTAQKTSAPMYKTPAGKGGNNEIGTITPKMKANTPQVLLRRPKHGEVALSYSGSPLMTGSVFREDVANINIPLPNGDLLSLLPQTGLRPSIIPAVGEDTRRQLEILRDNLVKMCSNLK